MSAAMSYREKFELFLVIAKLNLRETVLKQKNVKHNSHENRLVYSISWLSVLLVEVTVVPGENQTCRKSLLNFIT
jgi:hypothetical protein